MPIGNNKNVILIKLLCIVTVENAAEIIIKGVIRFGRLTIDVNRVIAHKVLLVEDRLIGAQEAPLDVAAAAEANVKHLAVGLRVGVVAVSAAVATKRQILRDLQ